jgi:mono/diheme cytochrome c family protein
MRNHPIRTLLLAIIAVVVVGGLAILLGAFRQSSVTSALEQPLPAEQMTALIPKGRELALAGDCFGCHSTPQGPMAAGGVAIPTPFGTLYSSNITPDPEHGIGRYTRADFHRALRDGYAAGKGNLYPGMPFVFTHITRPDDVDALYAYMMSIPPIAVSPPANTGVFMLPVRPFMNFWTLLNFPKRVATDDAQRSAEWNRGAYLVEGLAHCGACHSPRNIMLGTEFDRALQGGSVDGLAVPDITAPALTKHGFDKATLTQYLSTGVAPQGTAFSGMQTVTHFSTSVMEAEDVEAIATYLLTHADGKIVPPAAAPEPLPIAINPAPGSEMAAGRILFMEACSGCHGGRGEGIPNVAPAMKGNATLAMDDPRNTISVILNGIPTQRFTGGQRMYAMPPFAHTLTDVEITDLVTWMRAEWGGQSTPVNFEEVRAIARSVQ